ncbi:MAG: TonB-dependent receptor [Terracidiphilus sp.]|nr:TonB-dependent receptor [Terracidiphilus sp.]
MRSVLVFVLLLSGAAVIPCHATSALPPVAPPAAPHAAPRPTPTLQGVVADPSGAIIPGAEIDVMNASGIVAGKFHSGADGSFQIKVPRAGHYTLVVSEPGFGTVQQAVTISAPGGSAAKTAAAAAPGAPLHIVLNIAAVATNVQVNADTSVDLTSTDNNHDTSVLSSNDLKTLPIFDNGYVSAMGAFLDSSVSATGGSGLMVDGVEANRATVSSSAVQEVRINEDPYSARYYYPGRGQMVFITKQAADHYHGEFNFHFRDSALNAQNALAPSKPFEQRRIYEGHVTGPIPHAKKSSFLASFNRAEEDLDQVVSATVSTGAFEANVPAPTRDTEFSLRAGHQFGDKHQAYAEYSYQDWTGKNQGVGGQTLAAAGYNSEYHEDDATVHVNSALSSELLNQLSLSAEHWSSRNSNAVDGPRMNVSGNFTGGSAQAASFGTEYNGRISDIVIYTRGNHLLTYGMGIPHMSRRAFDDHTNELGTYTFGPTLDASGNVLATALDNYAANLPSGFTENTGDVHFIYHQQEMGAFVQDHYKVNDRLAITPGVRYDWQNFLATRRLGFSPRLSFAWVLDQRSKTILRGGGGIYYDRFGGGSLLDLERYGNARRRSVILSLNPATLPGTGCVPITSCVTLTAQPPSLAELEPNARIPYQMHYGVSIERQLGEKATGTVSVYSVRGIHMFRSVDTNAPTEASSYTLRPNTAYGRIRQMQSEGFFEVYGMDVSYRGRWNKYFTGFGRYSWSRDQSDTGGIGWFPQNQLAPNEWANSSYDQRQRLSMYAMYHPESVLNLAAGIFTNSGGPWTEVTGADPYGDSLFNARPDGVGRNSMNYPAYVDMDVRWGHDFAITPNKADDAPKLGFSAGGFNVLNHENAAGINTVVNSASFDQITSASPPRRIQLAMRFQF